MPPQQPLARQDLQQAVGLMKAAVCALPMVLCIALSAGCSGRLVNPLDYRPLNLIRDLTGPSPGRLAVQAFADEDADLRREGIVKMTRRYWGMGEPQLKGYALKVRDTTEDPTVRSVAIRALGRAGIGAAGHVGDVLKALDDRRNENVRWDAATALFHIIDDKAIEPLAQHALGDPSVDVRIACAKALRHYHWRQTALLLVICMDDPDFAVCREAQNSLIRIMRKDHGPRSEHWWKAIETLPELPKGDSPWWKWLKQQADEMAIPPKPPAPKK